MDGRRTPEDNGQRSQRPLKLERKLNSRTGINGSPTNRHQLSAIVPKEDAQKIQARYGDGPYKIVAHGQGGTSAGKVMIDSAAGSDANDMSFLEIPEHYLVPVDEPPAAAPG